MKMCSKANDQTTQCFVELTTVAAYIVAGPRHLSVHQGCSSEVVSRCSDLSP